MSKSDRIAVTDDVVVASQPSQVELEALRGEGFRSVINLRHDGEDLMPLTPQQEGEVAAEAGLMYVHVPVSMPKADAELVRRFREQLASVPKPVLVHCKLGQRAGALVMIDQAVKRKLTADQALERARELNMPIENPKLVDFIRRCLDETGH